METLAGYGIYIHGGRAIVKTPYCETFPAVAQALGGQWDKEAKVWFFRAQLEREVRMAVLRCYGTTWGIHDQEGSDTLKCDLALNWETILKNRPTQYILGPYTVLNRWGNWANNFEPNVTYEHLRGPLPEYDQKNGEWAVKCEDDQPALGILRNFPMHVWLELNQKAFLGRTEIPGVSLLPYEGRPEYEELRELMPTTSHLAQAILELSAYERRRLFESLAPIINKTTTKGQPTHARS